MPASGLPLVDGHETLVAASPVQVWEGVLDMLERSLSRPAASAYARVVGCHHVEASGPRPLVTGSVLPGFRVVRAVPGTELALEGGHRFSDYALTFRLQAMDAATLLRAETRAAFPGLTGGAYRLLVVGSGGHGVAVRGMLAAVRRRVES